MAQNEQKLSECADTIVIEKNRLFLMVLLVFVGLGLLTVGMVLAENPVSDIFRFRIGIVAGVVLVFAFIIVGISLPLAIRAAVSKAPGLVLDPTGIRGYGFGHIPWEVVASIGIDENVPAQPIIIHLHPEAKETLDRSTQWIAKNNRIPIGTGVLRIDKGRLDEMMQEMLARYGASPKAES